MFCLLGRPEPYAALGKNMALPQCATLALRAPDALLDLGYMWLPGFDEQGGMLAHGCEAQVQALLQLRVKFADLLTLLNRNHGWARRDVYLLGFSQGGTVALDIALNLSHPTALGGVVSVSGAPFPHHIATPPRAQESTPTLVTLGTRDDRVPLRDTIAAMVRLQQQHPDATKGWGSKTFPRGHCMINSEQETRAVMELLGGRFRLRNIAMEEHPDVRTQWASS